MVENSYSNSEIGIPLVKLYCANSWGLESVQSTLYDILSIFVLTILLYLVLGVYRFIYVDKVAWFIVIMDHTFINLIKILVLELFNLMIWRLFTRASINLDSLSK